MTEPSLPPPAPTPLPLAPPRLAPPSMAAAPATTVADAGAGTATWARIGLVAAIVIVVGSLAPWAKVDTVFGTIDVNGTSGDGPITMVAAGLVIAGFLTPVWVLRWIGALGALAVGGYDLINASSRFADLNEDSELAQASVAWGLWLVVVAAAVAVLAAALTPKRRRAL